MVSRAGSEPVDRPPDTRVHDGVAVPTRGARLWAGVGVVAAIAAVWVPVLGVVGMVAGSVAHLKGQRAGLPVAALAAVGTIAGMALVFWTRLA